MSSVEAVVFDLGNVLVGLDPAWADRIGVCDAQLQAFARSDLWSAFECGRVSSERFFGAMSEDFEVQPAEARAAFLSWVTGPLPGAVELIARVTVPVFAGSNTNVEHWKIFDPERVLRSRMICLASHHLGARKPEQAFYRRAGAVIGASRVLFLDDRSENVAAAEVFGWRAAVVRGVGECERILQSAGVLG